MNQEETIEGFVEKIVFRNAENGYTVLQLSVDGEETTCVGVFSFVNEGEFLKLTGVYVAHAVYGEQFKVNTYAVEEPTDAFAMERYLGSGAI